MPKKQSHFLAKIQAAHRREMDSYGAFVRQLCMDIALIAAADWGMNPDQVYEFAQRYMEVFDEYADTCTLDAKGDKELWYTWETLENRMRKAVGERFVPRRDWYGR